MEKTFTPSELLKFNGTDPSLPIYIAIKGIVFDVSPAKAMYVPGGSYHIFAGREASRALAMSSLKEEDLHGSLDTLSASEKQTLDQWESYYKKKYPVVGKLVQQQ